MIISRYHLPTRGTPEMVQISSADLHALLTESLSALRRCLPQIRGALPVQEAEKAIKSLESAVAELTGLD